MKGCSKNLSLGLLRFPMENRDSQQLRIPKSSNRWFWKMTSWKNSTPILPVMLLEPQGIMEKDKEPISSPEIHMNDIGDLAQVAGSEVDLGDLAHVAGSEDSTSIKWVGGHPGAESSKPRPFSGKRNRAITSLRIATWGKSLGCEGCSNGTYTHSKSCRDRFNKLLNSCEPLT